MTRAAIYVRVSSAKQAEDGLSLDAQERRCRRYIELRADEGWTLDEQHVYIERGLSGRIADRPELTRLRQSLDALDAVVIPAVSRLGRSAQHTLELFDEFESRDAEIVSLSENTDGSTAAGKLQRNMLVTLAQFESDLISERVAAVTPDKRARGSYNGGPRPYGYDFSADGGGLVPREDEAEIVGRLFREFEAGGSLRGIARALNEEGIKGPLGGAWSQGRVADRLDSALYAGQVADGNAGRHEPLVDAEQWRRVRELRQATAQRVGKGADGRTKAGKRSNTHLLGNGLLRCECGAKMYPRRDSRSGRDTYRCRGRDERTTACQVPPLPRAEIDGRVRDYISRQVLSPGMAEGDITRATEAAASDAAKIAAAATREVTKLEGQLRNGQLRMLEDDPPFGPTEWRELRAELQAKLTAARTKADHHRQVVDDVKRPSAALTDAVEAIRDAAADEAKDASTLVAQQVAIGRLFECFEILTGGADDASPEVAEIMAAQDRELGEPEVPPFDVKARRVYLMPMPRPEVALRFGATPLDSLRELDPNVRQGLPFR